MIPRRLRRETLEGLHAAHQGVVSMRARAATYVIWQGMDQAIQDDRKRCRTCDYIAPSRADEPSITAEPPVYHFKKVCTDYCELDRLWTDTLGGYQFIILQRQQQLVRGW